MKRKEVFGSKNQKNVELYGAKFTLFYFKRRNFIRNLFEKSGQGRQAQEEKILEVCSG